MILSVSRRTDIPSFYSDWFFNRIKAKEVYVRNPMNPHQISNIKINPDVVDCIVFWTKNPEPMLSRLKEIDDYNFYFQFTLNSYAKDVESGLDRKAFIIETFKKLSEKIGPERIIWRYDPIFVNRTYSIEYHIENFEKIAIRLKGYTKKCTVSFVDFYKKVTTNFKELEIREMTFTEKNIIAKHLSMLANTYDLEMDTCAEDIDLDKYNIKHAKCIDDSLIQKIAGYKLNVRKDNNQRKECGCIESIDIGAYNSCRNGCKYCYANYSKDAVTKNSQKHNPLSPLLIGEVSIDDIINEREIKSLRLMQTTLFD